MKKYETLEEKLFDLISIKCNKDPNWKSGSELLEGKLHILEKISLNHHEDYYEGEVDYRVYHADGYCFDVYKRACTEDDTDEFLYWDYNIFSDFDGFEEINIKKVIELIENNNV